MYVNNHPENITIKALIALVMLRKVCPTAILAIRGCTLATKLQNISYAA